jgi:Fur family ferric uptake transcriptional regulator
MLTEAKPQFLDYLKQQGLKWTPEREKVLHEAFATEGLFKPEELAHRLTKEKRQVSKAAVYRTLPILVKAGLILCL